MKPFTLTLKTLKFCKLAALATTVITLSACASISEDQCAAGNWLERGYKDGIKGVSSSKISKYADKCSKYGFQMNSQSYLKGYEDGVTQYCTYEQGLSLGENGSAFNQVCSGGRGVAFAQGYDAGRIIYDITQEHDRLIEHHDRELERLQEVRATVSQADLDPAESKRLRKKEARLENSVEDLRIEIRAFERIHDLPRYIFR